MAEEIKFVRAGRVIDGLEGKPIENRIILVKGKVIEWIGDESNCPLGNMGQVFDLSGHTILPGLIDCHLHTSFNGESNYYDIVMKQSVAFRTLTSLRNVQKDLEAGFTTVRVMGEKSHLDLALKSAINEGIVRGPRIVAAGQNITVTGGHADLWLAPDIEYTEGLGGIIANGPEEFRRAARTQLKYGADFIKLVVTGGVMSEGGDPGMPYLSPEEIRAAVEEAHRLGKKVAAHCHGAAGARISVEAGVDTIEHGTLLIKGPDVVDRMAQKRTFLVPTLAVMAPVLERGDSYAFFERKSAEMRKYAKESVKYAIKAGVRIATGTDAGSPGNRHGDNARELEMLVEAGMSEMEAILAATKVASECVGLEDKIGTLEKGKFADLIAVKGDPLLDISILKDVRFVMKEGEVIKGPVV
jgi:imidazolonepropionase-like amidohydrolase